MNQTISGIQKRKFIKLAAWSIPAFLFFTLIFLKAPWVHETPGPIIFGDETLHKEYAESIAFGTRYQAPSFPTDTIYPPLYPLLLAPAFLSDVDWYQSMIWLNIVASSALVLVVFLISRSLIPPPFQYLPVILASLLPFHAVFPRFLLAENLFLVVFLWAFYFSVIDARRTPFRAFSVGFFLSLSSLTKHLATPALPILIVIWWLSPVVRESYDSRTFSLKQLRFQNLKSWLRSSLPLFAVLLLGLGVAYSPWVWYALKSGFSLKNAFGFDSSGIKTGTVPPASHLALWALAYTSYLVLAIGAIGLFIGLYLCQAAQRIIRLSSNELVFTIAFVLITGVYLLLSIQHSWGAKYNNPDPQYILGRYLLVILPLALIAGALGLSRIQLSRHMNSITLTFISLLSLGALLFSRKVLYQQAVWPFSGWFAALPFNSPDTMIYTEDQAFMRTVSVTGSIIAILYTGILVKESQIKFIRWILSAALILNGLFIFQDSRNRIKIYGEGARHAKGLAQFLLTQGWAEKSFRIVILDDIRDTEKTMLTNGLKFFGLHKGESLSLTDALQNPSPIPKFFISGFKYPAHFAFSYGESDKKIYVYDQDADWNSIPPPAIEDFGPHSTHLGEGFNTQSQGASSIWVKAVNVKPSTQVYFDGKLLQTTYGNNSSLTAIVPNEFISKPGQYEIFLLNQETKQKSPSVIFEVHPDPRVN